MPAVAAGLLQAASSMAQTPPTTQVIASATLAN
jgi:hypothetical protein